MTDELINVQCFVKSFPFGKKYLLELFKNYGVKLINTGDKEMVSRFEALKALSTEEKIAPYYESMPDYAIRLVDLRKSDAHLYSRCKYAEKTGRLQAFTLRIKGSAKFPVLYIKCYSKAEISALLPIQTL